MWSQIIFWNLPYLRMSTSYNNCVVVWVPSETTGYLYSILRECKNYKLFCTCNASNSLLYLGCSWSYQNTLCWIPNSQDIIWISPAFWGSCTRNLGKKVSIFLQLSGWSNGGFVALDSVIWLAWIFFVLIEQITRVSHFWTAMMKRLLAEWFWIRVGWKGIRYFPCLQHKMVLRELASTIFAHWNIHRGVDNTFIRNLHVMWLQADMCIKNYECCSLPRI